MMRSQVATVMPCHEGTFRFQSCFTVPGVAILGIAVARCGMAWKDCEC